MGSQSHNYTGYFPDQNSMAGEYYDENSLPPQNHTTVNDLNTLPSQIDNYQIQNEQPNFGFVTMHPNYSCTGGNYASNQYPYSSSQSSTITPDSSYVSQVTPSCQNYNSSTNDFLSSNEMSAPAQIQVYASSPPTNIVASPPPIISLTEQQRLDQDKLAKKKEQCFINSANYRARQRAKCKHLDTKVQAVLPSMQKLIGKLHNINNEHENHPNSSSVDGILKELTDYVNSMEYHEKPQTP